MQSAIDHGTTPAPHCVGRGRLFFSDREPDIRRAQALCGGCLLRQSCAQGAIAREEPFGVWGGLSEGELRRAVRESNLRGQPILHS